MKRAAAFRDDLSRAIETGECSAALYEALNQPLELALERDSFKLVRFLRESSARGKSLNEVSVSAYVRQGILYCRCLSRCMTL